MLLAGFIEDYVNKPAPTYRTSEIPPRYTRERDDEVRIVSSRPRGRPRKPEAPPSPLPRCAGPNCIAPATQGHRFVCGRHWHQIDRNMRVELLVANGSRKQHVQRVIAESLR